MVDIQKAIEIEYPNDKISKQRYHKKIYDLLDDEQIVILFPSKEVSRVSLKGIKDINRANVFIR